MRKALGIVLVLLSLCTFAYADNQISVPVENLDFMRATFNSRYDCGVGAIVEIMAFYGQNGFPNLLRGGTFTGLIPDNGTAMQNLHQFFLQRVNSGFNGSYVPPASLVSYLQRYFTANGYEAQIVRDTSVTWAEVSAELEEGRPVLLLGYGANHYFVLKGITQNPRTLTVLWGHTPEVRTYTQAQIVAMGPLEAFFVRPVVPIPEEPMPDITAQPFWPELSQWLDDNGLEITVDRK